MAYFKILEPGCPIKWIKKVDRAKGTLEFQDHRGGYEEADGFYADSAFAYLNFHFKKKYPQLEYMTIDKEY